MGKLDKIKAISEDETCQVLEDSSRIRMDSRKLALENRKRIEVLEDLSKTAADTVAELKHRLDQECEDREAKQQKADLKVSVACHQLSTEVEKWQSSASQLDEKMVGLQHRLDSFSEDV